MMLRQKLGLILLTAFLLVGCESTEIMQQESVVSEIKPRFEKITWDKDGSQMALYMDIHEVTVGQFRNFVELSGYQYDGDWDDIAKFSPGKDFPMVQVSWNDATAYAKWSGKRLPTEAEWEYAARGGLLGKRYPLGDELTDDDANWMNTMIGKDQWKYCSPVGSFEANGYGLYDMVGNAFEWCADWYSKNYYSQSPVDNPQGPRTGEFRVVRGGFWSNYENILWVAFRDGIAPFNKIDDLGFRCVAAVPTGKSD